MTKEQYELVTKNMRLATYIVNTFKNVPYERDELDSAAYLGLTKAALSYDPSKGAAFSTWASYSVRMEILMYMKRNRKHIENTINMGGLLDTEDDLLEFAYSKENTRDKYNELGEFISLANLTDLEKQILYHNYVEGYKVSHIALMLNISLPYVSKIKNKALGKLRQMYEVKVDKTRTPKQKIERLKFSLDCSRCCSYWTYDQRKQWIEHNLSPTEARRKIQKMDWWERNKSKQVRIGAVGRKKKEIL